jgi:hypothetical protein
MRSFRTMREHANQAAAFARQRELQIEHFKQLQETFEAAKAAFQWQIANTALPEAPAVTQIQQDSAARTAVTTPRRQKRDRSHRLRVSLPRWFVNCVWELAVHEADGVWTTLFLPVNVRPHGAVVFDYVEAGDVDAVRDLLDSDRLSLRDQRYSNYRQDESLFDVSLPAQDGSKGQASLLIAGGSRCRPARTLPIPAKEEHTIP